MKRTFWIVAAASSAAWADDAAQPPSQPELEQEIVVVASRHAEPESSTAAAIHVFGAPDFERLRPFSVADVLRETPGAYVSSDGPPGQFTRLFLRGAGSNQTLVLVDGIPQNDATGGGLYDFGDLGMTGVERIEVLSGSYSVLYGSEAIGGVVSVTTRRGHGATSGWFLAEGGSFGTRREETGVSGGDDAADFAFAVGDSASDGAHVREQFREHDGVGRVGFAFNDSLRFDGSIRVAESSTQSPYDFATSGVLPSDGDIGRRRETASGGGTVTWEATDRVTVRATASAFNVYTRFKNGPDDAPDPRDELDSRNTATDLRGRLETTADLVHRADAHRDFGVGVTAGGEYLDQRSLSTSTSPIFGAPGYSTSRADDTTRTKSLFAQAEIHMPDLEGDTDTAIWPDLRNGVVTAGVRRDDHSVFGGQDSPYVGARVDAHDLALHASYGTGFRAPKPSELFDPYVGDASLKPETSESVDVGVSRRFFGDALVVGVTWFRLRVDDLIAYDAKTFKLANFARTQTTGFEYEAAADVGCGFKLRGSLTTQNPRDLGTGDPLANRARDFGSAGVEWDFAEWRLSLDGFFSGPSPGQGGEFTAPDRDARLHPGRRNAVDFSARYAVTKEVSFFGGIRNLLNDKSVATPNSPASPGIGAYVGVQMDF